MPIMDSRLSVPAALAERLTTARGHAEDTARFSHWARYWLTRGGSPVRGCRCASRRASWTTGRT